MDKTWILVADAARARCFERHARDHSLTELADFVFPQRKLGDELGAGDLTGAAGKGHGRIGHSGRQFEPRTELHAKERGTFARQLADHLNTAVAEQRCNRLMLIASQAMLGELKPCLSVAAEKALQRCITRDLTRYQGPELQQRINEALQLPD